MNYIRHLNQVFSLFYNDRRLSAHHVSAYMALFHFWNQNRFEKTFPIDRAEVMKAAKIGSLSTYSQAMHQLNDWGYLRYLPSNSPMIGSKVQLYTFGTTERTAKGTTQLTADETTGVQLSLLYNKTNKNVINIVKGKPTQDEVFIFFENEKIDTKEAEKFYNHFQANGWKVGGKSPMKDWKAAARNWILNMNKYAQNPKITEAKSKHLNTQTDKDYGEPL